MRETRTALPELVRVKMPAGITSALAEAAALDATKASEFIRRAVLVKLRLPLESNRNTLKRNEQPHLG
jgi:hypothetical protein